MGERARKYILDVMEDRRYGMAAGTIKCALWLLSQLYRVAVFVRTKLYVAGLFRQPFLGCLTISVGNITVGGTGKTPVVEALARALAGCGRRVAILSRGYRSKKTASSSGGDVTEATSPRIVSDGQRVLLDPIQAGDEPYLLAKNLPGVAVVVAKRRVKAGQYAVSQMGADTLILDDGFQHLPLRRNLDLVLIDCTNPFGNGRLLPRGILREPLRALKRADRFLLTKANQADPEPIKDKLRRINPEAEIIETIHHPLYLEEVISGQRKCPESIRGKDLYVVSAIARPESFENAVERLGGRIIRSIRFLDHHLFSSDEIGRILDEAFVAGAEAVVTTQKDAVRLPSLSSSPVPIFFLRVTIKITSGAEDFTDWLSRTGYI